MILGIHTTVTNPEKEKYPWKEAVQNYLDLADQVVVVDGNSTDGTLEYLKEWEKKEKKLQVVVLDWPQDSWDWSELPKHINAGLVELDTEYKLKLDIDCLIHEKDFDELRYKLSKFPEKRKRVFTLLKAHVLNIHCVQAKCFVPFGLKKSKHVVYGESVDQNSDWCYPIYWIGKLNPQKIPLGKAITPAEQYHTGVKIWNYSYFFRDKEESRERFWKFARPYREVGDRIWGNTKEESWDIFLKHQHGRLNRICDKIEIEDHPQVIQKRLYSMDDNQFGFNNWNNLRDV